MAATAATRASDFLARLRGMGLSRCSTCTLTRNRRVVVSFTGAALRVHEDFVAAPDAVLRAVVQFVEARDRRHRGMARRALLAFPIASTPARRRRQPACASDALLDAQLSEHHARLNRERFSGELRRIHVRVSRRMRTRLGHYAAASKAGDPAEIVLSLFHIRRHGMEEALLTLVHEMVHQWQDEQGLKLDHGRGFRAKARAVGISPFARRLVAA